MSLNDQMIMTFKFNKTNFSKMTKMIREEYNKRQEFAYDIAIRLYEYAKKQKIKTKADLERHLDNISYGKLQFPDARNQGAYTIRFYSELRESIVEEIYSATNNRIRKPRKSAFKKLTSKDKNFHFSICWESGVNVDSESQSIVISTEYNNHSADSLRNDFPQYLIRKLKNHKWGRGEGGFSQYRSENHYIEHISFQYPEYELLSDTWGKLGEQIRKEQSKSYKFRAKMYS